MQQILKANYMKKKDLELKKQFLNKLKINKLSFQKRLKANMNLKQKLKNDEQTN